MLALLSLFACDPPKGDTTRPAESGPTDTSETDTGPSGPPLVIVVLADDLGDNMFWAMPLTQDRLLPVARRFTRAYTTVPNCCPARSSFLTESYPSETGIQGNTEPLGGFGRFDDSVTLATRMQYAGFATGIFGKYLNGYESNEAFYVPPGWSAFVVPTILGDYTDTVIFSGSTSADAPGVAAQSDTGGAYLTSWLFDQALAFVDAHPDEPTFLFLTPQSPHAEATPAAEDLGTWSGYEWRPPSFAEEDVSDKPSFVQDKAVTDEGIAAWDARTQLMMENLASLDRATAAFYDGLDSRGLLGRTTLFFTSDNGMLHGEHRTEDKGFPYEESVRVPLLAVQQGLVAGEDDRLVAINLDIPATVRELGGVVANTHDQGESLLALFASDEAPGRSHVFLETSIGGHPPWAGVVTQDWKYTELGTGETELYDLASDPYELESLHDAPPAEANLEQFGSWVDEHRSVAILTTALPPGAPDVPYTVTFQAWGGRSTLTWTLDDGTLPPGLTLSADGVLSGTPTTNATYAFQVRVTDAELSTLTGVARTYATSYTLTVGMGVRAAARRDGRRVQFTVPTRPGARVAVSATSDDTWDSPPRRSGEKLATRESVQLTMDELDPTRTWHWRMEIDGIVVRGGVILAQ